MCLTQSLTPGQAAQEGTLAAQLQAAARAGSPPGGPPGAPLATLPLRLSRRIPLQGAELDAWHAQKRAAALEAAAPADDAARQGSECAPVSHSLQWLELALLPLRVERAHRRRKCGGLLTYPLQDESWRLSAPAQAQHVRTAMTGRQCPRGVLGVLRAGWRTRGMRWACWPPAAAAAANLPWPSWGLAARARSRLRLRGLRRSSSTGSPCLRCAGRLLQNEVYTTLWGPCFWIASAHLGKHCKTMLAGVSEVGSRLSDAGCKQALTWYTYTLVLVK